ncbi:hypothetical protein NW755_006430 [Fusarium falciforme]|uniref:Uncharacterized protein n=1 Tax=Fusarium falciforme TaxID=195108 RepID=A0A9W8R7X6_9HYPO|nr:hypothetical protein NW755_006430 [Fusarium falciforme]
MDLNVESAYEPYSHQGRFNEAEHGSGDKLFAAISDQQLLLKRKKADKGTQRTIEGLRLVLRVLELLLDLSTLALMLHAAIVWWTTRNKIVDNGSGWRIVQWPHTDMRPTWTMMGVAVGTTLAHVVSLITQCRKFRSMREGAWRTRAVYARSTFITAAWSAALAYFKMSNENAKKTRHWDLWSWTCNVRDEQGEIPWNSLCTEMNYCFIACLVAVPMEVIGLIIFILSRLRSKRRGKYGVLKG